MESSVILVRVIFRGYSVLFSMGMCRNVCETLDQFTDLHVSADFAGYDVCSTSRYCSHLCLPDNNAHLFRCACPDDMEPVGTLYWNRTCKCRESGQFIDWNGDCRYRKYKHTYPVHRLFSSLEIVERTFNQFSGIRNPHDSE